MERYQMTSIIDPPIVDIDFEISNLINSELSLYVFKWNDCYDLKKSNQSENNYFEEFSKILLQFP